MSRPNRSVVLAAAWVCVLAGAAWSRAVREATIHDDLARQLQRAVSVPASRAERQFAALSALRQLRDTKLQPLFADLAARPRADLRAEGILGLAELSADGNVSLAMVGEIKSPSEQSLVILEALAAGRLSSAQATEILSWPRLDPRLELALRARAVSGLNAEEASKASDADRLKALSASESALVKVLAETLLAHAGDAEAAARVSSLLSAQSAEERAGLMGPAIEMISREKLVGAAPIVAAMLPLCATEGQRAAAASTLMRVDPKAGSEAWLKQWGEASDLADQIRLALAAAESAAHAEQGVTEALVSSNVEPPAGIGRAIAALRGADAGAIVPAFVDLIAQGHAQSMLWALTRAESLPRDTARDVFRGVIVASTRKRSPGATVSRSVFDAAWRLAERDPVALGALVHEASQKKDAPLIEALLAGLIRGGRAAAWDENAAPMFPNLTTQSMALLYRARLAGIRSAGGSDEAPRGAIASGGGFDPASPEAETLRQIALGRGNLPEAYRVVASWLALCQDGKEREALTRLLAPGQP